jgi:hypothetical protein
VALAGDTDLDQPGSGFFVQAGAVCAVSQTIRFML